MTDPYPKAKKYGLSVDPPNNDILRGHDARPIFNQVP